MVVEESPPGKKQMDEKVRIERAIESMHTQLLYLATNNRKIVKVDKIREYFAHLESILKGME